MRLLILGASGFLGGHVWRQASAAGADVITAGRSGLPWSPAHHRLDLATADPAAIAEIITSAAPDAVANCAGATVGPPEVLAAANITGTYALVRAMLLAETPARLVHLGSAAEYGGAEPPDPLGESAPPRPGAPYGVAKLGGTRLVELGRAAGLDAVVLRVFNPVGAGAPETSLPGRVAAQLRRALESGADVRLGPLDAVRDFVDARDVAAAVLAAAAAPALPHAVINVGSGTAVPVRSLVKELITVTGYGGPVHEDSSGSARSGDLDWQQADITRAGQDLGWRPRHDLAASLADLWEASRDQAGV
ncbi:MAG TPA: NAD-dependent epimerase/dehydratase family protein [Streptosporangiaceae bacterium]|nr:NAD-dependent epimerase/dehydratase family protein [Streptosporangiaceae bacterium]